MAREKQTGKNPTLQIAAHIGSLIPLAIMIYDFYTDGLTINPIQELTFRTGKTALVLLVLSLACTPVYTLFKYRPVINLRRPLGVYAFVYVALHLTIFLFDNFIWSFGFTWEILKTTILEKRYALVGFAAFLILLLLALTSTKGWQKRLGKNWTRLHKLVYLADLLVIVHYVWLVKADVREPLAWGAGVLILLALRLPVIKRGIQTLRARGKRPARSAAPPSGGERVPTHVETDSM